MHRVTVLLLCALCSTLEGMCDGAKSAVAFNCASTSSICFISGMVFKNPDDTLTLANIEGKRSLSIKTGEITALRMEHCEGFRTFEKVTIGHTELQELCITSQFVQVMAEGNRIRTLHTDAPTGGQKLEILKLSNNKLSDAGALCQFKALKELHLENNQLSTLDMACFSQMSKLQKLLLAGNRLNHLAITSSTLELPALTTLDLRNNTLTVLDVSWTFDSLATLQLAFNNLTHVKGDMARFVDLQAISLSNNNWHCEPLDVLLTALQTNFVKIVDGDSECQGINNSTICCREVVLATEGELFGELAKFTELEQRYSDTNSSLLARLDAIEAEFQAQLDATKQIILKAAEPEHPEPDNEGSGDNEEKQQGETTSNVTETTGSPADGTAGEDAESITKPPTEAAAKEAASKEKKCKPQKPMDAPDVNCTTNLEEIRRELHTFKEEINPLLAKSRTEYQQLSLTTKLIKHEFRTAVHRGALKLKALANQLNELHLYMKSKFDSVK